MKIKSLIKKIIGIETIHLLISSVAWFIPSFVSGDFSNELFLKDWLLTLLIATGVVVFVFISMMSLIFLEWCFSKN
jgi:hypothetical protein